MRQFVSTVTFLVLLGCRIPTAYTQQPYKLLVVMLDGFRWDYLKRSETPIFDQIAASGVKADALIPVFPTLTIPNIYTVLTGVYPESHGLVSNFMMDPDTGRRFMFDFENARDWLQVEDIAATFYRQGIALAQVPEKLTLKPTSPLGLVKEAVRQLSNDKSAVFLYIGLVDLLAHVTGTMPENIGITRVEASLKLLYALLNDTGLLDSTNVLIFGDHGMATSNTDNVINVTECLVRDQVEVTAVFAETMGNVYVRDDLVDAAFESLSTCHKHLTAYRVQETPANWYYKNNSRIGQIVLVADFGWFAISNEMPEEFERLRGRHGYPNSVKDMHTIFMASGPSFRQGYKMPAFSTIHLYSLICHLMDVKPAPNHGDFDVVKIMLKNSSSTRNLARCLLFMAPIIAFSSVLF